MASPKRKSDKFLLFLIIFLVFYGLLILASASLVKSQNLFNENYYYLKHQLLFGVLIGSGLFLVGSKVHYNIWQKSSFFIFLGSLVLLGLLFLPQFGLKIRGATRWIEFGGFSFQPAEFVKIAFVIYLSAWLAKKGKEMKSFSKTIFPFLILNALLGIFFLLQPDMGSFLVILGCSLLLFFLAGGSIKHIAGMSLIGIILLLLLIVLSPYRLPRLKSFLSPEENALSSSYQVRQSIIGIGSGGLLGKGYGQSFQKKGYLPEAIGDSVFVILVEELGFVAGAVLVIGFLVLSFKGFRIAKRSPNNFSALLASGISALIVYQAFINIAAISGIIPLTGITLPLVSYGSSSYIMTLFSLGILFNISTHTKS